MHMHSWLTPTAYRWGLGQYKDHFRASRTPSVGTLVLNLRIPSEGAYGTVQKVSSEPHAHLWFTHTKRWTIIIENLQLQFLAMQIPLIS